MKLISITIAITIAIIAVIRIISSVVIIYPNTIAITMDIYSYKYNYAQPAMMECTFSAAGSAHGPIMGFSTEYNYIRVSLSKLPLLGRPSKKQNLRNVNKNIKSKNVYDHVCFGRSPLDVMACPHLGKTRPPPKK